MWMPSSVSPPPSTKRSVKRGRRGNREKGKKGKRKDSSPENKKLILKGNPSGAESFIVCGEIATLRYYILGIECDYIVGKECDCIVGIECDCKRGFECSYLNAFCLQISCNCIQNPPSVWIQGNETGLRVHIHTHIHTDILYIQTYFGHSGWVVNILNMFGVLSV